MVMTKSERCIYERALNVAQKYQDSHEKLEDLRKFLQLYAQIYKKQLTEPEKDFIKVLKDYLK